MSMDESDKYDATYGQARQTNQSVASRIWDGFDITTTIDNADEIYKRLINPLRSDTKHDFNANVALDVLREAWRRGDPNATRIAETIAEYYGEDQARSAVLDAMFSAIEQGDANTQDVAQRTLDSGYAGPGEVETALLNQVERTQGMQSLPAPDTSTLLGQYMAELNYEPLPTQPAVLPSSAGPTSTAPMATSPESTTTTTPVAPSEMGAESTTTTTVPSTQGLNLPAGGSAGTGQYAFSFNEMVRLMIQSGQRDLGQQMDYMEQSTAQDVNWDTMAYPTNLPSWLAGRESEQLSYLDAVEFLYSGGVSPAMLNQLQKKLASAGYLDGERANFAPGDVTDSATNAAWRSLLGDVVVASRQREAAGLPPATLDEVLQTKINERSAGMVDFTDPKLEFRLQDFAQQIIGRGLSQSEVEQFSSYLQRLQSGAMQYDLTNPEVQGMYAQDYMAENMQEQITTQVMGAYTSNYGDFMKQVFG